MTFTHIELWREAQREAALRKNVYQRWIKDGRMSPTEAAAGIAKMEAIAALLEPLAQEEIAAIEADREAENPRLL